MVKLDDLPSVVLVLVIVAIFGIIAVDLVSTVRGNYTSGSLQANISDRILATFDNMFRQFGLVGTVLGFAVIIGILIYLWSNYGAAVGGSRSIV